MCLGNMHGEICSCSLKDVQNDHLSVHISFFQNPVIKSGSDLEPGIFMYFPTKRGAISNPRILKITGYFRNMCILYFSF